LTKNDIVNQNDKKKIKYLQILSKCIIIHLMLNKEGKNQRVNHGRERMPFVATKATAFKGGDVA